MHTSITAWSFASLVVGSALAVVACGSGGTDSSKGGSGSSQGGSSAASSGGAGETRGGTESSTGGNAETTGSGGTEASTGGNAETTGGTESSSGGNADTSGSGGTASSSGGRGGNTGAVTGGSTGRGGAGGGAQGGTTSTGGRGVNTGGRQTAGAGGSGTAGSGGRSDAAGGRASGGDAAGGGTGEATGGGSTGGATGGGLTDPVPSQGCGKQPPAEGQTTFDVGGTEREYILRLPAGYDGATPNRIIFAFHGASGSADQVDQGDPPRSDLEPTGPYFGIKDEADDHTIFVAGQANSGWSERDIDYVQALLERLEGALCIDESRIFATGFSMGGMMTITVACDLSDIFRAVAPMSGSLQNGCAASGQHIAYWSSHGTNDPTIAISQGEAARDEFVQRNHCQTSTTPIQPDGCVAYDGCDSGYPVDWCPFEGVHEPPPFSGPAIWAFLSQF
jgi:polyhydroxybutyrate depolymerase